MILNKFLCKVTISKGNSDRLSGTLWVTFKLKFWNVSCCGTYFSRNYILIESNNTLFSLNGIKYLKFSISSGNKFKYRSLETIWHIFNFDIFYLFVNKNAIRNSNLEHYLCSTYSRIERIKMWMFLSILLMKQFINGKIMCSKIIYEFKQIATV